MNTALGKQAGKISAILWATGFFTCTWDLLLTRDVGAITLKIHQGLFLFSFLFAILAEHKAFSMGWKAAKSPFALSILGLILFYFFSTLWSYFPLKSFLYSGWLLFNFATIWITLHLNKERLTERVLFNLILGTAGFLSVIILVDQASYWYGFEKGLIGYNQSTTFTQGLSRPHAFAMEPSYAATFLALAGILCTPLTISKPVSIWKTTTLAFCLIAIALTTSRTGWFGYLLGMGFVLTISFLRNRRVPWREVFALGAAVFIVKGGFWIWTSEQHRQVVSQKLLQGITTGNDGSSAGRVASLKNALAIAGETKFLGVGLGASWQYLQQTRSLEKGAPALSKFGDEAIMSIWGQLLAEGGLVAVFLYGLALFSVISALWRAYQSSINPIALGALSASLVFFFFITLLIGNIARGDVWVWLAIWSVLALPRQDETPDALRES